MLVSCLTAVEKFHALEVLVSCLKAEELALRAGFMHQTAVSRASHLFQGFTHQSAVSRLAAVEGFHAPEVLFYVLCTCFMVSRTRVLFHALRLLKGFSREGGIRS